jgi:hypothetical protein
MKTADACHGKATQLFSYLNPTGGPMKTAKTKRFVGFGRIAGSTANAAREDNPTSEQYPTTFV